MKNPNDEATLTTAEFKEFMQEFKKETDDHFMQMYKHMNARFDDVDKKFEHLDERFDYIVRLLDRSTDDYKTLVEENAANAYGIARIDDALEDHETRIGQLENVGLRRKAA